MGREQEQTAHDAIAPPATATRGAGNSGRTDHRDAGAFATDGDRPVTDGGWNQPPDGTDDPFIWGPDRDAEEAATDEGGVADDGGVADEGAADQTVADDGGAPDDEGATGESPADRGDSERDGRSGHASDGTVRGGDAGAPTEPPARAPGGPAAGEDVVPESVAAVERHLERLESLAEALTMETINANIKRVQGEREALEAVHDELDTHARAVERTVEHLEDRLDEVREAFRRRQRDRRAGRDGAPRRAGPTATVPQRLAARFDDRRRGPRGQPGVDGGLVLDGLPPGQPDAQEATDGAEAPAEFLIPGTELRDLWRVRTGNGPGTERWMLETSERMVADGPSDDLADVPPEVAEFTLDPDEMAFEEVLDVGSDDG